MGCLLSWPWRLGTSLLVHGCELLGSRRGASEEVGELLVRGLGVSGLLPELWGEEGVGVLPRLKGGLDEVAHGLGGTPGAGVDIIDTGHLENLLGRRGRDDSRTLWRRDETDGDGTALAVNLGGHGVHLSDLVTPVSPSDWNHGKLGGDDGAANGGGDLLGALDAQAKVSVLVSDGNEGLESGSRARSL